MSEKQIKELLLEKNEEFKQIFLQHYQFEKELNQLNEISFKSNHEVMKCKEIKRKKLLLKDQMQTFINDHKKHLTL